ncbi:MAG: hypothetical protein GC205_11355 [Bacteroidetes bacterium]|nr:hypothetical protein [Bacteroidota bacterium]
MQLKQSLSLALVLALLALVSWEVYLRSQGRVPDLNDDKNLWARERAKVDKLTNEDVILTGSSRVLFDVQLYKWERLTSRKPLQLASPGSSPLPVFHDLVQNTDFAGTIVVGVTEGLFFSTTFPEAQPWARAQNKVDHYHNRTYAQRLNFALSLPFQKNLALVSINEEEWPDDTNLKALLTRIQLGNRSGEEPFPPFNNFAHADDIRNTRMSERTATDTAFAGSVQRVWMAMGRFHREPEKEATLAYFLEDARKFTARGGNLILLRCPSSGPLAERESKGFPRELFWDELVNQSGARAYHYKDYESLSQFECPEWSHLSGPDADVFTSEWVSILKQDIALTAKAQ